jgi:hypothetical protein
MIAMMASKIAEITGGTLNGNDVEVSAPAFLSSAEFSTFFITEAGTLVRP